MEMRRQMSKRVLSLLMSAVMMFSCIPAQVLATGESAAAQNPFAVSQGVCAKRVATVSYGKEYAFPGDTEEAYAKSRRGVTVVELSKQFDFTERKKKTYSQEYVFFVEL